MNIWTVIDIEKQIYKQFLYKYKVIIDKSVSMIEVYDKYNVIEQDGKIWTIEDKKNK